MSSLPQSIVYEVCQWIDSCLSYSSTWQILVFGACCCWWWWWWWCEGWCWCSALLQSLVAVINYPGILYDKCCWCCLLHSQAPAGPSGPDRIAPMHCQENFVYLSPINSVHWCLVICSLIVWGPPASVHKKRKPFWLRVTSGACKWFSTEPANE